MKQKLALLLLSSTLLLFNSACRTLPPLKAAEIHSTTTTLGVHVSADAMGISITERTLRAADVKWTVSFPGFSHITTAKDYQQSLPKDNDK